MGNFRVKLDAVGRLALHLKCRYADRFRACDHLKTCRNFLDGISMGHPHLGTVGHFLEQILMQVDVIQIGTAILPNGGRQYLSAVFAR